MRIPAVRWLMLVLVLLVLVSAGACWWAGDQIASPPRRPLQDYHREFLADPVSHGVNLQSFALKDGTPCLLVEPDKTGRLGSRGIKVREQLQGRGLELKLPGQIIGTLVLVHGRMGRKEDYLLIAERLCAAGFRCLLADMPAHGDHPAKIITFGLRENELPRQVLTETAKKFGFSPAPAGLMGMSMGGSVAMHAAEINLGEWKALVVLSTFDRLEPAIRKNVSGRVGSVLGAAWCGGTAWVYKFKTGVALNDIRSDICASKVRIPTLMAHGSADQVIPYESGQRLFAALPADIPKQWVTVPDARHDNVLITDFPLYATVAEWMLKWVK